MTSSYKKFLKFIQSSYSDLPRAMWFLAFILFVNRTGSMVLFFMPLYLTQKIKLSLLDTAPILSLYGAGSLVGVILGGWLCDKIGSLFVQLGSLVLSAIGFILLGYITDPLYIALMLFFLAIVNDAFRPANSITISKICAPEIRAKGFGLSRVAVNLGMTIGPALGGFLADKNYHTLFWVDGATSFLAAIFMGIAFRHLALEEKVSEKKITASDPLKDYYFFIFLFFLFLLHLVFAQISNIWSIYLKEQYHLAENKIGMLLSLNALGIVLIGMPLLHHFSSRSPLLMMAFGSVFLCGGFSLLPFGSSILYASFTVILWTFGEAIVFPLATGFVSNHASDQNRGKYMGSLNFTFSLGSVVAPLVGFWLYSRSPTLVWECSALVGLVTFIGFYALEKYDRKKRTIS
ncbi:MAG: MFS transporter [Planctomycetota bacterium]